MHSTQLRQEHINGTLLGVAIGEALGIVRDGLTRRQAIKLYGARPSANGLRLSRGLSAANAAQVMMVAQALVASGTELDRFTHSLMKKTSWYALSMPSDLPRDTWRAGISYWLRFLKKPTASPGLATDPALRSLLLAPALHKTNLGLFTWVNHAAKLTHSHPAVLDGCRLLARLTGLIIDRREPLNPVTAIRFLADQAQTNEFKLSLKQLSLFLENRARTSVVARHFGWAQSVPNETVPVLIMSIYCFLRHPTSYQQAVDSAICLGGATKTLGAIVGGLSGAHLGVRELPRTLVCQLHNGCYSRVWIAEMSERLAQWPHGADDLHHAPAVESNPLSLVIDNIWHRWIKRLHWFNRVRGKLYTTSPALQRRRSKEK
jgi:ADP-ribosyl-[dinitrogen reductase] hydrolase